MRTLLVLVLFLAAAAAQAQEKKTEPLLTVAGSGEARVTPDLATVRLGVVARADNAQVAQDRVNAIAQKFRDRLRDLKIPAANLQTSQLELSPVYVNPRPNDPNPEPRITGYTAQNVLAIRLEDLAQVGPVIDAGVAVGANQLQGVQFGLRDETPSRLQALRDAVAEARRKASAIADALGVRLGPVQSAEEGVRMVQPVFEARAMAVGGAATPTSVEPGQLSINADVTLRYSIQQP